MSSQREEAGASFEQHVLGREYIWNAGRLPTISPQRNTNSRVFFLFPIFLHSQIHFSCNTRIYVWYVRYAGRLPTWRL